MSKGFLKGAILYAVIFLLIAAIGITVFWNFIDAYEQSRPMTAVNNFLTSLSDEMICVASSDLVANLDSNIQSQEMAYSIICDQLSDQISVARKSGVSASTEQHYILRVGSTVIGQMTITPNGDGDFGFENWEVSRYSFDFTYLLSDPIYVTVPSDYTVKLNGVVLGQEYICEENVKYEALEPFYDQFALPTLNTYSANCFLGDLDFEIHDRYGNPVAIEENMDLSIFLPECTPEMTEKINSFAKEFLHAYVVYTGGSNGMSPAHNYYFVLYDYLLEDTDLTKRLYTAIDGLQYAQSNGDTIQEIQFHQVADLGNGRYYCDVTYIVETWGKSGAVETTNNLKLIILDTEDGLKVEAMTRY